MTRRVDYPQPRDFAGDGIHSHDSRLDREATFAERAKSRQLRGRLLQDGERTYTAYSLDELIEIDSLATHGRPGHLFG